MYSQTPIIAGIVSGCNYSSYLELGIRCAQNFKYIAALECIQRATAVDIDPNIPLEVVQSSNIEKKICTTDEFFEANVSKYDAIFIDADHSFDSVRKDFENSLSALTDMGTIFLHDTDPADKELLHPGKCSNSYLINNYLHQRTDIKFVTLPVHIEGLTLVRKNSYRHDAFTQK
jgi:hypothetical protein